MLNTHPSFGVALSQVTWLWAIEAAPLARPLFRNFRTASYDFFRTAGKTDAEIIAGAGRTNIGVNASAGAFASAGVLSIMAGGCP